MKSATRWALTHHGSGVPENLGRGIAKGSQDGAKVQQVARSQVIIIVISVFVVK
ncbi:MULTISPECIES: hypothetical protein [Pseudomonas]|jgi:hypothetical protein|uniref:hypothetical protein n=1 Tax=Pseudomonas TaxID=286 RepID=UPI0012AEC3C0|nr:MULTISPECIES: hypothetical protein [Pseudomonas]